MMATKKLLEAHADKHTYRMIRKKLHHILMTVFVEAMLTSFGKSLQYHKLWHKAGIWMEK